MKIHKLILALLLSLTPSHGALHYDDLCGENDIEPLGAVLFKRILGDSECICFGVGTYIHTTTPPPPQNCSLIPSNFTVPTPSCMNIPSSTKAIQKLTSTPTDSFPHASALFTECEQSPKSRVKREDKTTPAPGSSGGGGNGTDEMDEDFSSQGEEIGQELMRNQMNQYIESVIAKLTGLQGEGGNIGGTGTTGGRHKYPVIKLMDYTKQIMQKTCTVVNPDFFDLALNSFINLQLETYHIKEPYIGYSAFKRIEQAMGRCLKDASPHLFVIDERNSSNSSEMCDNHVPTQSSNQTVADPGQETEEIRNITIPSYASSELEPGKIAEPLIESVWKMLVSTHSYCYMYFSDYFNDHHTYTVALLPLFTNEIQEVWLNEVNGTKGYDLSNPDKTKLYGGLLGNVTNVMRDVDYCVGASRAKSAYPWFMNRPLRDSSNGWNKRKKRDVEEVVHIGDVVVGNKVVATECKGDVEFKDVCEY